MNRWRKACSDANFAVLLTKKAFSERERATSNCTGDHRYKNKALSHKRLQAVKRSNCLFSAYEASSFTGDAAILCDDFRKHLMDVLDVSLLSSFSLTTTAKFL